MFKFNFKFIFLFSILFSINCFDHEYIVTQSHQPRENINLHFGIYTLGGLIPIYSELDQWHVCPDKKVRMINMYDSPFNGAICGFSLLMICPQTIAVECIENKNVKEK